MTGDRNIAAQVVVASLHEIGVDCWIEDGIPTVDLDTPPDVILKAVNLARLRDGKPAYPDVNAMATANYEGLGRPVEFAEWADNFGIDLGPDGAQL